MKKKLFNACLRDGKTGKIMYVNGDDKSETVKEIDSFLYIGYRLLWADFSF